MFLNIENKLNNTEKTVNVVVRAGLDLVVIEG